MPKRAPVAAVSISVIRGDEVLLFRRAKPPLSRHWTPPGGRINWREAAFAAAKREVLEETGVVCEPIAIVDVLDWVHREALESHHVLICIAARWISGEPVASSDVTGAGFYKIADIGSVVHLKDVANVIREAAARVHLADAQDQAAL
jgi:8-oxo-dGTP diphosphatase